jgi:uncharacterized protein (DUF4415 family)
MNEAIDFSDIPELGDEFFANATRREARVQKHTVLVDRDVYEWFNDHVPESSTLISQLLRDYMEEQKKRSTE